jgi:hypothetical protein
MKKKLLNVLFIVMLVGGSSTAASSSDLLQRSSAESAAERSAVLMARLERIKEFDQASLSRTEKRMLRSEVKEVEKELKEMGGGVYISVGAIIIILLLLIILL